MSDEKCEFGKGVISRVDALVVHYDDCIEQLGRRLTALEAPVEDDYDGAFVIPLRPAGVRLVDEWKVAEARSQVIDKIKAQRLEYAGVADLGGADWPVDFESGFMVEVWVGRAGSRERRAESWRLEHQRRYDAHVIACAFGRLVKVMEAE